MISPISGTYSTKQASKQNKTRDIEIKNTLTVIRGERGGDNGGKRGKGNMYKGHMDKTKVGRIKGGKWGWMAGGGGRSGGGKMETTILEQQ